MHVSRILIVAVLAAATAGAANAQNLVSNADFSQTTPMPTQPGVPGASPTILMGGQFIDAWQYQGQGFWMPDAERAWTVAARVPPSTIGDAVLMGPITAPAAGAGSFIALDADTTAGIQASVAQTITGLTAGKTYIVEFDWGAAAQLPTGRTVTVDLPWGGTATYTGESGTDDKPTDRNIKVSFGTATPAQQTMNLSLPQFDQAKPIDPAYFSGWRHEKMQFMVNSTSAILHFLAESPATSTGAPPMALLTNVSVTEQRLAPPPGTSVAVPASSLNDLIVLLLGLAGLGLFVLHRREHGRA